METALNFAEGAFEVDCLPSPGAPDYIETYEDQLQVAPGMIRLIRENEERCDAFIIACHCCDILTSGLSYAINLHSFLSLKS